MPVEPTPENLLTVASYGITGRIGQLIDVLRVLDELHGPRNMGADDLTEMDTRCKTCRTSSGKPCPWPCTTWMRFGEILELSVTAREYALFQAVGKARNGGSVANLQALFAAVAAEPNSPPEITAGPTSYAEAEA